MSKLLKAAPFLEKNFKNLQKRCSDLSIRPKMLVFLVGDNSASQVYVGHKKRMCEKIGAECEVKHLKEDVSPEEFLSEVDRAMQDESIHGTIIQLPLPKQLEDIDVYNLVAAEKDIDGFHMSNLFKLYQGSRSKRNLMPCTPKGILKLLKFYNIELAGKRVAILGRSLIVGRPLSLLLNNSDATVTLCHSKTQETKNICRESDIIISAIGRPKIIDESYLNPDKEQTVIDVGIVRVGDKIFGDTDFEELIKVGVHAITPVPGGVGPMTVYCLLENLLVATENKIKG